jgi:uncharacterized membrane protein YfcA
MQLLVIPYLPLFFFLSLIAEVLGTIGGFGSSVFFVPIANYFIDFQSVLGITAIFHLASNISKIYLFRSRLDKKLIINLGIPAILFVIIGAVLSKYLDRKYLEIGLALFLILFSSFLLIKKNFAFAANAKNSIIGGGISGFAAGMLGTGGAIRGITMAAFNLEKNVFVATSAVIDLGIDLSRTVVYFFNGYIHKEDLYLVPILIIVGFVGSWIGKIIINKISQVYFRTLVLVLIAIIGGATLTKALYDFI